MGISRYLSEFLNLINPEIPVQLGKEAVWGNGNALQSNRHNVFNSRHCVFSFGFSQRPLY
ncbi:hypothetical protein [Sporosarcina sp. FSL K6-1508]|uniref:hypothetical protein n=1 Tax=Sporosarcina sp. FSL K6-1508 TaxID=2921553 RepID=UPI0030F633D4